MNNFSKLLFSMMIGLKKLDERQEYYIYKGLAMCLVYLFWIAFLIMIVGSIFGAIQGDFFILNIPLVLVCLFVVMFIGIYGIFDKKNISDNLLDSKIDSEEKYLSSLADSKRKAFFDGIFFGFIILILNYYNETWGMYELLSTTIFQSVFFSFFMYLFRKNYIKKSWVKNGEEENN